MCVCNKCIFILTTPPFNTHTPLTQNTSTRARLEAEAAAARGKGRRLAEALNALCLAGGLKTLGPKELLALEGEGEAEGSEALEVS